VHCYPDSGAENKKKLDKDDFDTLYRNFEGMRFERIFLSGGEPLLDESLFEYAKVARAISKDVFICTNGTLINEDILTKLHESGVTGITISIQHSDVKVADEIYQSKNILDKIQNAIKLTKSFNFKTAMDMTLIRNNYEVVDQYFDITEKYDVDIISFKRFREVGRGNVNKNDLGLTPEENYKVLKQIFKRKLESKIFVNVHDPLYNTVKYDYYSKLGLKAEKIYSILADMDREGCSAGVSWVGINPFGDVSPCPLLLYKDIIIGNIFNEKLTDIINNSNIMKKLQTATTKNSSCKYGSICRGCRVASIARSGDVCGHDPMCIHEGNVCPITEIQD
jgi:radical SAM protein with 4Fe4S-binding SPASM domain